VFDGLNDDGSARCSENDSFANEDYVRAWERIEGVNHIDRSGDIIILMKDNMGDITQRFTTGVSCKSWHGSLNRIDSFVPFIIAYPGGNKYETEHILKKDNLCNENYSNCKGNWKLSNIVKEIISIQYNQEVTE
jgi:hypothetical protein